MLTGLGFVSAQTPWAAATQLASAERVTVTDLTYAAPNTYYLCGDYRAALLWDDFPLPAPTGIGAFAARVDSLLRPVWILADPGPNTDAFDVVRPGVQQDAYWAGSFRGSATLGDSLYTVPGTQKAVFLLRTDTDGQVLRVWPGTGNGTKTLEDLTVAPDGSVYFTGSFTDTLRWGDRQLISTATDRLAYVGRLTPDGTVDWLRALGTAGIIDARAVTYAGADRLVVSGDFNGTLPHGDQTLQTVGATKDVFVLGLRTDGTPTWARRLAGEQDDRVYAQVTDASGRTYLTGSMTAVLRFIDGPSVQTPNFETNAWLAAVDSTGAPLWLRTYGNEEPELATDLALQNGQLWLTGIFRKQTSLAGIGLAAPENEGAGFVLRTDLLGNPETAFALTGTDWVVQRRLAAAPDGSVVVGGRFNGALELPPYSLAATTDYDGYLARRRPVLTATAEAPLPAVLIYPNPATDSVRWRSAVPVREVRLYDWTGSMWRRQVNVDQLETTGLPRGAWIVELTLADGRLLRQTILLQ